MEDSLNIDSGSSASLWKRNVCDRGCFRYYWHLMSFFPSLLSLYLIVARTRNLRSIINKFYTCNTVWLIIGIMLYSRSLELLHLAWLRFYASWLPTPHLSVLKLWFLRTLPPGLALAVEVKTYFSCPQSHPLPPHLGTGTFSGQKRSNLTWHGC